MAVARESAARLGRPYVVVVQDRDRPRRPEVIGRREHTEQIEAILPVPSVHLPAEPPGVGPTHVSRWTQPVQWEAGPHDHDCETS